jgi:hypothetical protein
MDLRQQGRIGNREVRSKMFLWGNDAGDIQPAGHCYENLRFVCGTTFWPEAQSGDVATRRFF